MGTGNYSKGYYSDEDCKCCPNCRHFIHISRSFCPMCGYVFDKVAKVAYDILRAKKEIVASLKKLEGKLEKMVDKK